MRQILPLIPALAVSGHPALPEKYLMNGVERCDGIGHSCDGIPDNGPACHPFGDTNVEAISLARLDEINAKGIITPPRSLFDAVWAGGALATFLSPKQDPEGHMPPEMDVDREGLERQVVEGSLKEARLRAERAARRERWPSKC